MRDNILVSIVGPTAIGKTKIAIALAGHFKTEILSADSRQFYREMSIGTAVPSLEDLQAVLHHFIQHKSISDEYNVGDFERDVLAILERLFQKYRVVVLVGGSGLYVDAVTDGLHHFPEINPNIRKKLNDDLALNGLKPLQDALKARDLSYYQKVDLANPHRLIRALEVCIGTGLPYSSFLDRQKPPRPFKVVRLGIRTDRAILYQRIEERVDQMMVNGLLEEVNSLMEYQHLNAMQTVGYKELFRYLNKECDLGTAVAEIKKNTRRFAKRQMTWFRKNKDIHWVSPDTNIGNLAYIIEQAMSKPLPNKKGPIYFIMGVSGSGKTTIGSLLAKALHIPFYDGDDYHSEENVSKMAAGHPLTDTDRQGWLNRLNALAKENIAKGAVIVCSALKESYRDVLSKSIETKVSWVFLKGSAILIRERLHKRKGHFMPSGLLQSQFNTLQIPDDGITIDIDATPKSILKDILARIGPE